MNGPVVMLREYCGNCACDRDIEVARAALVSSGYALAMGYEHEREQRCLHCGTVETMEWWPDDFERAVDSARYLAA